jgi:hypothetical protein
MRIACPAASNNAEAITAACHQRQADPVSLIAINVPERRGPYKE